MAKLMLKNVRLSFPDLFQPASFDGSQDPKYGATFLLKKEGDGEKQVKDVMTKVAEEKWGKDAKKVLNQLFKAGKTCLGDGDDKEYDGYEGHVFVSARSGTKPLVLDKDKSPLDPTDGKPYSGCYVNASVEIWAQDNKWGKRVNAQLRGVQFYSDGEPFSGCGVASEDEFDAFESEDSSTTDDDEDFSF